MIKYKHCTNCSLKFIVKNTKQANSSGECSFCSVLPAKVYLIVDFKDKDEVKDLGGKWDPIKKQWWVFKSNFKICIFNRWYNPKLQKEIDEKERRNRIYLDINFRLRDMAKKVVQAQWEPDVKMMYVTSIE